MTTPELDAWRDFCRRMEAVGESLLTDGFPPSPEDRAEGFAHLAEQVVCWMGWSFGHADPHDPRFQRQNDLVTPWGGPNVDNIYRHARVEAGGRYRVRGEMRDCDDFILAVRAGFMGQPRWGTLAEVTASDLGIRRGDEFELLVGGDGIALPEGAATVSIREYYIDWTRREPATFVIERLDAALPRPRVTGEQVVARLEEAAAAVEHSLSYWNSFLREYRAKGTDNRFEPAIRVSKGLEVARYAYCFFDLAPDEALVVESEVPAARYWSLQMYTHGWFEPFAFGDRVGARNQAQVDVDPDGRIRVVVAHRDPGVPNWLDTGGRREGLLMFRWFWPTGPEPSPTAHVERLDDVRGPVTPAERAEEVARRREHVAWRFRT